MTLPMNRNATWNNVHAPSQGRGITHELNPNAITRIYKLHLIKYKEILKFSLPLY